MKIPFTHYIRFWLNTSALSIGTGFLFAYFSFCLTGFIVGTYRLSVIFLLVAPIIILHFIIHSQLTVARSYWGSARGRFEYSFLDHKLKNDTKAIVHRILATHQYYGAFNDRLAYIFRHYDTFSKKLDDCNINFNELQFLHLFFKAKLAIKEKDYNIAIGALKKAKSLKQNDLILNFWLGKTFEYMNEQESSVYQYDIASKIAKDTSSEIYRFFKIEKERVELKGCKSEPKLLGFRYS